jgi:two-component system, chemotaxis family, sensor kinase CheA
MNILVIEDDPMLRRALGHYLLDIGHMVSTCGNGQEALEFIKDNPGVDLVIVDVIMPVLSGASFLILMKKHFPQGLPHIIIISAVKEGENFVKQIEVPYDHYIQKPIDFEDLGELIASWDKKKAG